MCSEPDILPDVPMKHHATRTRHFATMSMIVMAALLTLVPRTTCAQSTRLVRSTEPPAWGATVQVVPELRIGLADGDEHYLFGRIRKVAIGKDGTIIVADDKTPVLRMYDANGKFVRDIGRAGEALGEYRWMGGVGTFVISATDCELARRWTSSASERCNGRRIRRVVWSVG